MPKDKQKLIATIDSKPVLFVPQARTPRQVYEDNRPPKHILLRWRFKCALILCGFHGVCHMRAQIWREIRANSKASMAAYWFWQGDNGHELNQSWRMK